MKTSVTIFLLLISLISYSQEKKTKANQETLETDLKQVIISMDKKIDSLLKFHSKTLNGNERASNSDSLVKVTNKLTTENKQLTDELKKIKTTSTNTSKVKEKELTKLKTTVKTTEANLNALKTKEKENIEKEISLIIKEPSGIAKGLIDLLELRISNCDQKYLPNNTKALNDFKKARAIILESKILITKLYSLDKTTKSMTALNGMTSYDKQFTSLVREKNLYLKLLKKYCSKSELVKDDIEFAEGSYEKDKVSLLKGEINNYTDYPFLQKALKEAIKKKGSNLLKTAKHNCD